MAPRMRRRWYARGCSRMRRSRVRVMGLSVGMGVRGELGEQVAEERELRLADLRGGRGLYADQGLEDDWLWELCDQVADFLAICPVEGSGDFVEECLPFPRTPFPCLLKSCCSCLLLAADRYLTMRMPVQAAR